MMVPTRLKLGRCGLVDGGGGGGFTATGCTLTTGGGGGRRDGEKIGLSRVAPNERNGTDHSGFPVKAGASGVALAGGVAAFAASTKAEPPVPRWNASLPPGGLAAPTAAANNGTIKTAVPMKSTQHGVDRAKRAHRCHIRVGTARRESAFAHPACDRLDRNLL